MTTYYVATTGNDSTGTGAIGNPWLTVAHGLLALTPGDTLYLRTGTYAESITDSSLTGGTSWLAPVLIAGYPGEAVTLQPASGASVVLFSTTGRQYIELRNLILDAVNCTSDCAKVTYSNSSSYAHHVRFSGCEVKNAPTLGNGILITNGGTTVPTAAVTGVEILDCLIHDNGGTSNLRHGVYCEANDTLIDGNTVYNSGGYGIQHYKSGATAVGQLSGGQVTRNICHDNNKSNLGQGGMVVCGTDTLVANNVCYNNTGSGSPVGIKVGASDCTAVGIKLYNNTLYGNTTNSILIRSGSVNTVVSNNVAYSSGSYSDSGTGTTQSTNFNIPSGTTNPLFTNAAGADFSLQASSPCIDAGTDLSATFTTDILGNTRPGGAWDIGAYEYGAGVTLTSGFISLPPFWLATAYSPNAKWFYRRFVLDRGRSNAVS